MKYIYLDVKRWEVLKLSYQIIDCTGIEGVWVYRAFQFSLRGPTPPLFLCDCGVGRSPTRHTHPFFWGGAAFAEGSWRELESPVYPYPFYSGTINNLV